MSGFLNDDFLLDTPWARRLYHDHAESQPILDYHSHLPPDQVANNAHFTDLAQLWLASDHYKWRLMRANGIAETDITGHEPDERTFRAWAQTVPHTVGNPMYHWVHLELRRFFGVSEVLSPATASRIWAVCNEQIADPGFRVHALLNKMKVAAVCTTDDPADDLAHHRLHALQTRPGGVVMAPTFRPDRALACDTPGWPAYVARLGATAGVEIVDFVTLVRALEVRHQAFHAAGCRLSDHGMGVPPAHPFDAQSLRVTVTKSLAAVPISAQEREAFQTALLVEVARLDAEKGWTMQLHMGVQRNLNTAQFARLGADTGFDATADEPLSRKTAALLDALVARGLPQVILYALNPSSTDALAAVMGCFQDGSVAGKVQLGSAWWFNDHIEGMKQQMTTLANQGLLSRFVGMLTDSRSFLSFPRHEYFRRVLCQLVGGWVERGLAPDDPTLLGNLVENVCYANARDFLKVPGVS